MKRRPVSQKGIIFSAGNSNQRNEVIKCGSSKDVLPVIHKVHRKVHGSKLGLQTCIPIPLWVTELISSLAPDECGRYTGFHYADAK